ncbi:hypothetical protein THTE_2486 [Thermogutta terrifontis]|uniref:Uncharacterized protein n=1 Tax=Thermogutta terrifontis TaxID=1331910 RepID=A0A286RGJ5_9BACT|nr:hypothetical protein THTE_2486 [Thermogutta terrifontis]
MDSGLIKELVLRQSCVAWVLIRTIRSSRFGINAIFSGRKQANIRVFMEKLQ